MAEQKQFLWPLEVLKEHVKPGLYGSVSFQFLNGEIVSVKVEHTLKPPVDGKPSGK